MASNWYFEGFFDGDDQLLRMPVKKFPFTIGRSEQMDLALPTNNASRLHAEILNEQGELKLIDHNSTNGSFVNRQQLHPDTTITLEHGDILHFADFEVRLIEVEENTTDVTRSNFKTVVGIQTLSENLPSGFKDMRQLLADELVTAAFQPIVDVQNNNIHAYEILGRGVHPDLDTSPGLLFNKAESFKMAVELSELFRTKGIALASSFHSSAPYFLNIHPEEHKDNRRLLAQLKILRNQYPDVCMVLELHEQVTSDIPGLRKLKTELEALDIRFAYDDFGAGQTRLLELVEVPADYLKFDIALVRDIHKATAAHREMVEMLVKQAQKAGTLALAEGIEQYEDVEVCRALGFDLVQGYYFGKPNIGNIQQSLT